MPKNTKQKPKHKTKPKRVGKNRGKPKRHTTILSSAEIAHLNSIIADYEAEQARRTHQ